MTTVAEVDVAVEPTTNGFGSALEGQIGGEASSAGSKIGTVFGNAFKVGAVAVTAVAAAGVSLVGAVASSFGDLEQGLGGSTAVFGDYAASIQSAGVEAYKNLGMSQAEYLATANKMGSLFQGSGMEQVKALDLTQAAMQRAADVASVMGVDTATAMESIAGAAKGNFTMMDNLGVAITDTSLKAYAMENGFQGAWESITPDQKSELAIQMFLDRTGQYAGNFATEATQTISGSFGLLQASVGSLMAGLGDANADVGQLATNVVDAFGAVVNNLGPLIENIGGAIGQIDISGALTSLVSSAAGMIPTVLEVGVSVIGALVEGIATSAPGLVTAVVPALVGLVGALLGMLPTILDAGLQIIVALASGIADALPTLIPQIVDVAVSIVEVLIANLPLLLDAGLQLLMGLVQGVVTALPQLVAALPQIITGITTFLTGAIPTLITAAVDLFNALVQALPTVVTELATAIPLVIQAVVDFLVTGIPMLIEGAITLFMAILEAVPLILPPLLEAVVGMIPEIVVALVGGVADLIGAGLQLLGGMLSGFVQKAPDVMVWVMGLPGKVLSWLGDTAATLPQKGRDFLAGVLSGLGEKVVDVTSWFQDLPGKVVGWLGDVGSTLKDSGQKLINGFIDGIKSAGKGVKDAIGGVLSDARNLLPFSPAKEGPFSGRGWTLYGGMSLMAGFAQGIEAETSTVQATLEASLSSLDTTVPLPRYLVGTAVAADQAQGSIAPDLDELADKIVNGSAKVAKGLQEGVAGHGLSYASRSSLRTVGARP